MTAPVDPARRDGPELTVVRAYSSAPQPAAADPTMGAAGRRAHEVAAVARVGDRLRRDLSARLPQRIRAEEEAGRPMTAAQRRALAEAILHEAAEAQAADELAHGGRVVSTEAENQVITAVLDEVFGMAGLQPLLDDPGIENININGCDQVFVRYADGRRERRAPVAATDADLIDLVRELAARSGVEERRFDRGSPAVNLQLPDGSRLFAVMAVTQRPCVSIRRHRFQKVTMTQLRGLGVIDRGLEAFLTALVRARRNILITGGVGAGKTTLLRGLASVIPAWEHLVTIEDAFELGLGVDKQAHPHVTAMQAREPNVEGEGAISQSELVRWALRMSPDRVIVGEIRGPEVVPMCNAMSQGNDGSMATLHSSFSQQAFMKLATYAIQGPERLPMEATNLLVASAVHFVVHLTESRGDGRRVVSSVREIIDADDRQVISNEVYRPGPDLRALPAVPLRADTLDALVAAGYDPDLLDRGSWPT